jgi:UDP:flavonoid glycosyltransferase YjiC (YdhE family)
MIAIAGFVVVVLYIFWRYLNAPYFIHRRNELGVSFEDKLRTGGPLTVAILVVGSTGDVHVFISFGIELKRRGHNVIIITEQSFAALISSCGLRFFPLKKIDIKKNLQKEFYNRFVHAGDSLLYALYKYWKASKMDEEKTSAVLNYAADACDEINPDVMVCGSLISGGVDIAEARGIPCTILYLAPKTPSSLLVNHLLQIQQNHISSHSSLITKLLYYLYDMAAHRPNRTLLDDFRTKRLNLNKLPSWMGPRWRAYLLRICTIYSYSATVLPPAADWPDCNYVAGFFPSPPLPQWAPSAELKLFVEQVLVS